MDWKGKSVLVTGAGGFIGSHLTEALVRLGASVTALIRYNSRGARGSLDFVPQELRSNIRIVMGDIKDADAVSKAVGGQEVVFHLAALIGIPYSYVHPVDYVQTNVLGTSYLLSECLRQHAEKVVHTSTSEVYGSARYVPIDEEHPLQGQSPYSASKIAADQMAGSFFRSFGLPVAIVRPFNTYGPRQPARAVIPTIITQALRADTVKLGALSPTRDLTFVADTVNGFIKVAESPATLGQVTNIGSGKEISIEDLARLIFELMDKRPDLVVEPQRLRPQHSEVDRLLAGTEKAGQLAGWSPRVSLREGLAKTIDWVSRTLWFYQVESYHV
jgi:NAD dependent epimerase/dehydratase